MPAEKPPSRCSENRRCNKPIMEKRRRARINSCLNDLKALILEALKKDPARHSKLEKADILEMTVKHLQNLQRQQTALAAAADPQVTNKFRAGFNECADEVSRYLVRLEGMEPAARQRLLGHLAACMSRLSAMQSMSMQPFNIHTSGSVPHSMGQETAGGVFQGLQLVPTRLPNGDLALLLPANYSLANSNAAPSSGMNMNSTAFPTMASPSSTMPLAAPASPMLCSPPTPNQQSRTTPTTFESVSPHHHQSFFEPASPRSSCSTSGTPSPPPSTSPVYNHQQVTTTTSSSDGVIKREPLMSSMVERFRDECRTGSRLPPWATRRQALVAQGGTGNEQAIGRVPCSDMFYKEDSDREPWRPW